MQNDEFHKRHTLSGMPENLPIFQEPSEVPKVIGPYKIESLLEKGGMSILYLGLHPETSAPTTIKVLLPRFLSRPDVVQHFLNEAEIIALTDHPNIVKLYGHGAWEEGLYIAMEYIDGISLRQMLQQNPISLKKALEIVIDISYALCHLHTHGVIHRDVKPENILINNEGQVKVIDFGIAQLLTEKKSTQEPSKQHLIGTPIYMSPEQREHPESVSYPSDIYSLGIILYELALGRLSHGQIHLSLMPKGLQKILNKALQPLPQNRYQDVVDFITDVSNYLNSPNFSKEKMAGDQAVELIENLRSAQNNILALSLPQWKNVEVGLSKLAHQGILGIYYDFFTFPDGTQGIFIGESSGKGAESLVQACVLKGMVQALWHLTNNPAELFSMLDHLIAQSIKIKFNISYLILYPEENKFAYLSCGGGILWKVSSKHPQALKFGAMYPELGTGQAEFSNTLAVWEEGDVLAFTSTGFSVPISGAGPELLNDIIVPTLEKDLDCYSQSLADTLLFKAKLSYSKSKQENPLLVITIKKINFPSCLL